MLNQAPRSVLPEFSFPSMPSREAGTMFALQYQFEASQWLPPETIQQRQLQQLRKVFEHARQTVPYYSQLFAGFDPARHGGFTLDFLRSLPISTRIMVQAANDRMHSSAMPATHGRTFPLTTSGSTGHPVRLLRTEATHLIWQALTMRDHAWHERDFSRRLSAIKWAEPGACLPPEGHREPSWGAAIDVLFDSAPASLLNVTSSVTEQIAWLLREKPGYLISYPSNLAALARHCLREQITLPGLLQVRTIGETLTSEMRDLFRSAWNADTVDMYSCEEAGYIALQCPLHPHYHVQSENVLVEIVDEHGQPCQPGQTGRVLISSLHNFATPLLRYELGDHAVFGSATCSCGRNLPVITSILGRTRNRLHFPDGRSEFPNLGQHDQIHRLTGVHVSAFQFIQHNVHEIEAKYVLNRPFTPAETDKVARMLQDNFGYPFRIRVTLCDAIPRGSQGKFEEFVSFVA